MVKRHTKASKTSAGGIIEKEAAIHVSNVSLIDAKSGKPTRVGYKFEGDTKIRVSKRSGDAI